MVSPPHEAMHRIFQHDPGLFSRVSRYLGVDIPRPTKAAVLPTDLTETRPVERRVDTLLRFETEAEGPFLLAIESQGQAGRGKAGELGVLHRIPVDEVPASDRAPGRLPGPRHSRLGPARRVQRTAPAPHAHPAPRGRGTAQHARDHGPGGGPRRPRPGQPGGHHTRRRTMCRCDTEGPVHRTAGRARGHRGPHRRIHRTGPGQVPGQARLEEPGGRGPFLLQVLPRRRDQEEARAEARAEGRAEDVLLVLEQRGLDISDAVRSRVTECGDPEVLRSWLARAVTVPKAEEIFEDE